MMHRRSFLFGTAAGAAVLAFSRTPVRAATAPGGWLTGYGTEAGTYGVARIDGTLTATPLFESAQRLHKILKHPTRYEICAPARRPGTTLMIWRDGETPTVLSTPENRHFYGHAAFTPDGGLLMAAENDFDGERGMIGLYDSTDGYRRVGEFFSGGIGPHEMRLHPDARHLLVANGGMLTHPNTGRAVLNRDTMVPTLSLIDFASGTVVDQAVLPEDLHQLSIRHFAVAADGLVAIGLQDQLRASAHRPLVGVWRPGSAPVLLDPPAEGWGLFNGYIGSMALDRSGRIAAATSPRGGAVGFWDMDSRRPLGSLPAEDVCGIASMPGDGRFLITTGHGQLAEVSVDAAGPAFARQAAAPLRFDNHCQNA